MSTPESIEDYYARILAAADDERRLPVAVEEMPGWDVFPFELDSLRLKPLQPLADVEPARSGEEAAECRCLLPPDPALDDQIAWSNERWALTIEPGMKLPLALILRPVAHCDLPTVPDRLAEEMGRLVVAISAGLEALPSVGRAQVAKYGDGGAHLHLFFFGRPARMLQFRGSPLLDWEENLPPVPLEVIRANAEFVAERVLARVGGLGPRWN
jgi:hypothetical protein